MKRSDPEEVDAAAELLEQLVREHGLSDLRHGTAPGEVVADVEPDASLFDLVAVEALGANTSRLGPRVQPAVGQAASKLCDGLCHPRQHHHDGAWPVGELHDPIDLTNGIVELGGPVGLAGVLPESGGTTVGAGMIVDRTGGWPRRLGGTIGQDVWIAGGLSTGAGKRRAASAAAGALHGQPAG
jgi:hypothetical protein